MEPNPQVNTIPNWGNKSKESKKQTRSWLGFLRGDNLPVPAGTMKRNGKPVNFTKKRKTQKGGKLKEYQLRALSELSYRSPKVVKSNLKLLTNTKNRRALQKALNKTKQYTRKH